MTTRRRVFFFCFLIYLCLGLSVQHSVNGAESAAEKKGEKIIFRWAFCALKKSDAKQNPVVIRRDSVLKSGDRIKFYLKPVSSCYPYLLYQSSQGGLSVLYPARFKQLDSQGFLNGEQYIPEGNQWFELDEHTGREKFYLLVSIERLVALETLVNQYESADRTKKTALADKITEEIRNLRKHHLKFKTYAEKPVTIIGNLRGGEKAVRVQTKDIADYAVEISTTTFFSRTYTIDHQQ